MNDDEWTRNAAAKEDGQMVSVGGLVTDMEPQHCEICGNVAESLLACEQCGRMFCEYCNSEMFCECVECVG